LIFEPGGESMSRPHRRALAWLARHPTVLVVAVAFTASVAVAAVGDVWVTTEFAVMGEVDVQPMEGGGGSGGPNNVEDN
jgi:hypothetical protein